MEHHRDLRIDPEEDRVPGLLDQLIDPRRIGVVWLLGAFVITSGLTRFVTRRIRAREERQLAEGRPPRDGMFRNIRIGGVHIHHQVWGILLALFVGLLLIAYRPTGTAFNILAGCFGIGAALALDEFAMWLHLKDVYWSTEGRASISALMTAATICVVLILGSDPLDLTADRSAAKGVVAAVALVVLVLVTVCILKGKLQSGLIGLFFPPFALIGAWRLAKPRSWWARRNYPEGSRRRRRSEQRFGEAYERRWEAIRDWIGGKHHDPRELARELSKDLRRDPGR